MSIILFEKSYPPKSDQYDSDVGFDSDLESFEMENGDSPQMTYEEIMKELTNDIVYVLKPERISKAVTFVQAAIAFAEIYEIDTKIVQHDSEINVDYFIRELCYIKEAEKLILYADEVSLYPFYDNQTCILSLEYRTHSVYRQGRLIRE